MRKLGIALGVMTLLISGSAQAQQDKVEACRAAIRAKFPCAGTRPNTPARSTCVKAAMQRCKQGGPGAI
jgi:hypothetical protein